MGSFGAYMASQVEDYKRIVAAKDAEIARLNSIIDAEREMQAKLAAEGTRLSNDLAAARAALAGEREACDEFGHEFHPAAVGFDAWQKTYLELRAKLRARRAAESKGEPK